MKLTNETMSGKKFNKLTVIRLDYRKPNGQSYWIFQCDCGKQKSISMQNVKNGLQASCGCLLEQYRQGMKDRNVIIRTQNAIKRAKRMEESALKKKNKRTAYIDSVIGKTYGRLHAVEFVEKIGNHNYFLFRCDCNQTMRQDIRYVRLQRNNEYCGPHCPFYEEYWMRKIAVANPMSRMKGIAGKTPMRFDPNRITYGHSLLYWQQKFGLTRQRIHQLYQNGILAKRIEKLYAKT